MEKILTANGKYGRESSGYAHFLALLENKSRVKY